MLLHKDVLWWLAEVNTKLVEPIKVKAVKSDSKYKLWALKQLAVINKQLYWAGIKARPYYEALLRELEYTAKVLVAEARRFWVWAEPYLRRFDAWLGKKVNQYETAATGIDFGSEMVATVRKWWGQSKELLDYNLINQQLHK